MQPSASDQGPRRYRIADYAVPPGPPTVWRSPGRAARVMLRIGCWVYAAGVLAFWSAVNWPSPGFWAPHLLLYGPRWTIAIPALILVPAAIWMRSRWPAIAFAVALVAFLGIWGFNIPWGRLVPDGRPSTPRLRLLTCNVQGSDLKVGALAELVRETDPDIVLLQEYPSDDPRNVLWPDGWHVRTAGEFCVASRHPIERFEALTRPDDGDRAVAVRTTVSWCATKLPIVSVHLMTPRRGLRAILDRGAKGIGAFREIAEVQRGDSGLVRRWIEKSPESVVLAGDFNLTSEHPLFRRDWSAYADAFTRTGWGLGQTMFTRRIGLRIDHILSGEDWRPTRCWVVGTDVGSAHRAVIADLVLEAIR